MPTIRVKIRAIVPKEIVNVPRVRRNIEHVMVQKTGWELRKEFQKTVSTWKDKPNFHEEHYFGPRVLWVKVYTYFTHYRLVNAGAAPHIIRPRRSRTLRFQMGFRARSRPRVIGSFAGGKFGAYISTNLVHHPGFEAREFDKTIGEEYAPIFQQDVQDAIEDAIAHR